MWFSTGCFFSLHEMLQQMEAVARVRMIMAHFVSSL